MEWIFLESLVALAIAVAIVGWTIAPLRKRRKRERSRSAREDG
jgi:hypothetical protein